MLSCSELSLRHISYIVWQTSWTLSDAKQLQAERTIEFNALTCKRHGPYIYEGLHFAIWSTNKSVKLCEFYFGIIEKSAQSWSKILDKRGNNYATARIFFYYSIIL